MAHISNLQTLEQRLVEKCTDELVHDKSIEQIIHEEFARFETEVEAMSNEPDELGQARLTDHEVQRLPTGNQHSDDLSIIKWQCVKAAAIKHNVQDWTAKVDGSLSYEENIDLIRSQGDFEQAREKSKMRWAEPRPMKSRR